MYNNKDEKELRERAQLTDKQWEILSIYLRKNFLRKVHLKNLLLIMEIKRRKAKPSDQAIEQLIDYVTRMLDKKVKAERTTSKKNVIAENRTKYINPFAKEVFAYNPTKELLLHKIKKDQLTNKDMGDLLGTSWRQIRRWVKEETTISPAWREIIWAKLAPGILPPNYPFI